MEYNNEFKKYAIGHLGMTSTGLHDFEKHMGNKIGNMEVPMAMTPSVIEERKLNAVAMSVFDRLMMDRIIFLGTGIDDYVANVINAQLLFLQSVDSKKDIQIYVNSPGGSVYAGLGIYDTMQYISPDIATINTGIAASMAFVLLCAGEKGKRTSLPHARAMQHQPMGGASGQASDIAIVAKQIDLLKTELYEIISKHTGQKYATIEKDADRDHWMRSYEAKKYGVIDKVLEPKKGNK